MREVGCKDNLLGYPMVERAINLVLEDESYLREVCGKLYPVLCEEQPDRAARSIKRVVEAVFDGIDQDTFQRYFSGLITMNRDIPTNAQFIARMANIIRDRM